MSDDKFWLTTPLDQMTKDQWESLCDGCGKCCVIKLEDVDDNTIHYTDIGCKQLDNTTCRCKDYANRKAIVPDCVILTPDKLETLPWMPSTCAYRLIYEGRPLPDWHHLITGDPVSIHQAGKSVTGKIFLEGDIAEDDYPDHIKDWNNT
jgi:uncharacterized cysteine cluster protein YcgN (CxxCxxCC family)